MDEAVERYFRAMQCGPEGEDELVALFAEEPVDIEVMPAVRALSPAGRT